MLATVKYQIATYSGTIQVDCSENDENEYIISKAKNILRRQSGGSFPLGCQYFEIANKEDSR